MAKSMNREEGTATRSQERAAGAEGMMPKARKMAAGSKAQRVAGLRGAYMEALLRLRAGGILAAILLGMEHVIWGIYRSRHFGGYVSVSAQRFYVSYVDLGAPMVMVFLLAAPLMTLYLMQYQMRRDGSDFYHGLPLRRRTQALAALLAVWTACGALLLLGLAETELLGVLLPHLTLHGNNSWALTTGCYLAAAVFTSALMMVALGLTGTTFSALAAYVMALIAPRTILTVWWYGLMSGAATVPKRLAGTLLDDRLNVAENLVSGYVLHQGFDAARSAKSLLYTLCLGLLYTAAALALHERRPSETAGQPAVSRRWQCVLRLIPACLICLLPALLISEQLDMGEQTLPPETIMGMLLAYLLAVLVYFLYELLTTHRLRACARAVPGLLWLLLFNVVSLGVVLGGSALVRREMPDASRVREVRLVLDHGRNYAYSTQRDYYYRAMEDYAIRDAGIIALLSDATRAYQEVCELDRAGVADAAETAWAALVADCMGQVMAEDMETLETKAITYLRGEGQGWGSYYAREGWTTLELTFSGGTMLRERRIDVPGVVYERLLSMLGEDAAYRAMFTEPIPLDEIESIELTPRVEDARLLSVLEADAADRSAAAGSQSPDAADRSAAAALQPAGTAGDSQEALYAGYCAVLSEYAKGRFADTLTQLTALNANEYPAYEVVTRDGRVQSVCIHPDQTPGSYVSYAGAQGGVETLSHALLDLALPEGIMSSSEAADDVPLQIQLQVRIYHIAPTGDMGYGENRSWSWQVVGSYDRNSRREGGWDGSTNTNYGLLRELEERLRRQEETALTDTDAPYAMIVYQVYQSVVEDDRWQQRWLRSEVGYCSIDEATARWIMGIGQ